MEWERRKERKSSKLVRKASYIDIMSNESTIVKYNTSI